nr:DUF6512 family protein [uncultured Niameybacter sp.]
MQKKDFTLPKFICIGIAFVIVIGSLLHFTYEWSGNNLFVSFFAPVNESVWEHFKLGFFPIILYGLLMFPLIKDKVNNYIFGLGFSSLILNTTIVSLYYLYTSFTHRSINWIDISIFIIGVIVAFVVFYKILSLSSLPHFFNWIGLAIIVLTICLFIIFTISPLTRFEIFKDPTS